MHVGAHLKLQTLLKEITWRSGMGSICRGRTGIPSLALPYLQHPGDVISSSISRCRSRPPPSHLLPLFPPVPATDPRRRRSLRLLITAQNFPLPCEALMVIILSSPGQVNSIFAFLIFYCLFIRWTLCELSSSHSPVVPSVKLILTKKSGHFFLARKETFQINGNVTAFHTHCHLSETSNSHGSFLIAGINS